MRGLFFLWRVCGCSGGPAFGPKPQHRGLFGRNTVATDAQPPGFVFDAVQRGWQFTVRFIPDPQFANREHVIPVR